jgi:WXG100 family type VII secretion target
MADKTEVNYEELQAIVKQLTSEAEAMNQLMNMTRSRVEHLHGGHWIGRGSDQFFNEMEHLILPSMNKLVNALNTASNTVNQITTTFHEAENEAQNSFKSINF